MMLYIRWEVCEDAVVAGNAGHNEGATMETYRAAHGATHISTESWNSTCKMDEATTNTGDAQFVIRPGLEICNESDIVLTARIQGGTDTIDNVERLSQLDAMLSRDEAIEFAHALLRAAGIVYNMATARR